MDSTPKKRPVGADLLRRETQVLPCKLTPDEIRDRGEQLAKTQGKLEELDAEEKGFKAELKAKREPLERAMASTGAIVRAGIEYRAIEVEVWADYASNRVDEVRSDTGEIIRDREVRPEERQKVFSIPTKGEA